MIAAIPHRRLRVAHVTPGLDMGGLEKLLVEFARHAGRERFELRFVCLGSRGVLADEVEALGWPVTALDRPAGFRPGLILALARLFRRWQIDVVHTHDDRAHIHGAVAARLAGVRRVLHTRHGRSPQLTRRQTALVNVAAGFTDRFVCVSRDSARLTVRQGAGASRVTTIRNGIDLARFPFAPPRIGGPAVTVARLNPEKDVATLLRAVALVVRDDPAFRLDVAGDGPCLPELRQQADTLGIAAHVRFLGQRRDVPALLARAGLFVLPSLSEGISLTLLEAMASGVPVVATRVGGTPEVVDDSATGLLVPAADPSSLARALLRLRHTPDECRRLADAARRRVEERFDVSRMVASYEALYVGRKMPDPSPERPGMMFASPLIPVSS